MCGWEGDTGHSCLALRGQIIWVGSVTRKSLLTLNCAEGTCLKLVGVTRSWKALVNSPQYNKSVFHGSLVIHRLTPSKQQSCVGNSFRSLVTCVRGGLYMLSSESMTGRFYLFPSCITVDTNQNTHLAREVNCHFESRKTGKSIKMWIIVNRESGKYCVSKAICICYAAFFLAFIIIETLFRSLALPNTNERKTHSQWI